MNIISPFSHPIYVMTKPVGAACNLNCSYCYYLEKSHTISHNSSLQITDDTLELFIKQYIEAQTQRDVLFIWHGGEPMLKPISFYNKVIYLQERYAQGHHIDNCIQTNGTLINADWCKFLKENNWLVGISIDGPEQYHNLYRTNRLGETSFTKVMQSIQLLNEWGVEWNAMAVVHSGNVTHPKEFYQFFKDINCHYIQFTPIVERTINGQLATIDDRAEECKLTPYSITPSQWGTFCCSIFDEWVKTDIGEYFVQLFDATLANWCNVEPGVCSLAKSCGYAMAMEPNGDVYSCDHFVFPQFRLGNIHKQTITQMGYGTKQTQFRKIKSQLPQVCQQCKWLFACNGECPKNRFCIVPNSEHRVNYLCHGYKQFFEHVKPYMDRMKQMIERGRCAADIMDI